MSSRVFGVDRRYGAFSINEAFIKNAHKDIMKLTSKVIILRAEYVWHKHSFEYVGWCEEFEEVPVGVEIPTYQVISTPDGIIFKKEGE